jgi:hypothetical protein
MLMFDSDKLDRSQACVELGAMIDVECLGGRRDFLMFLGGRREMMFTERNNVAVRPYKSFRDNN